MPTSDGRAWTGERRSADTPAREAARGQWRISDTRRRLDLLAHRIGRAQSAGETIRPEWVAEVAKLKDELSSNPPEAADANR